MEKRGNKREYVVGILNFVMDDEGGADEVITRVTLKDDRNREFNKNLQFIFLLIGWRAELAFFSNS